MFGLFRDKTGDTWRITQWTNQGRAGQDILCGLTLAETFLVLRYLNGADMTGGEKNQVEDLIENNVCPVGG